MGSQVEADHPNAVICRNCRGSGDCSFCGGRGKDPSTPRQIDNPRAQAYIPCRRCGGSGICTGCLGGGWIVIPIIKQ
jgi:DnaJ-class molecular chaperone